MRCLLHQSAGSRERPCRIPRSFRTLHQGQAEGAAGSLQERPRRRHPDRQHTEKLKVTASPTCRRKAQAGRFSDGRKIALYKHIASATVPGVGKAREPAFPPHETGTHGISPKTHPTGLNNESEVPHMKFFLDIEPPTATAQMKKSASSTEDPCSTNQPPSNRQRDSSLESS